MNQANPEHTEAPRRSIEPLVKLGWWYRRSEEAYQRFHESFESRHTNISNLPPGDSKDLDTMPGQEIDEAMSQIEKEAEVFHSQKKPRL